MTAPAETLAGLTLWLKTESPTHAPAAVNRMMDLVADEVADAPIAVERIPGRAGLGDVLVLRAGPQKNEPAVLVMSHLDTVHPLGTADRDLPVRLEGDRLYGPGCYDMKGGAYLALQALQGGGAAWRGEAAIGLPGDARRGDRQPDDAADDRGSRPEVCLRARHRAGSRRRQGRDRPQGRRPLRGRGRGPRRPFRCAPPGRPQRHPRGGTPDPAHREHDRLPARGHHDGRNDLRRHRRERHPAALPLSGRSARHQRLRRRGLFGRDPRSYAA